MLQGHTRNVRQSGLLGFVPVMLLSVLCSSVRADDAQPTADSLANAADADHRVVDVVESLGVDVVRGPSSDASSGAHALISTGPSPMPMLLWVDSSRSTISLLRAADGHLLSRRVAGDTFSAGPYAAAVIASELVELMREAPLKGGLSGSPDANDLRAHVALDHDGSSLTDARSPDAWHNLSALAARVRFTRLSRRRYS